ncbi:hypothetical protein CG736_11480 [Kitasatospora sp. CB02891]|nr:hypothetical protein CG736_11480 [Kitasatospora sp. CB02891]
MRAPDSSRCSSAAGTTAATGLPYRVMAVVRPVCARGERRGAQLTLQRELSTACTSRSSDTLRFWLRTVDAVHEVVPHLGQHVPDAERVCWIP